MEDFTMTRHIIDRPATETPSAARMLQFLRIDQESHPNPAAKALQKRGALRDGASRLRAYYEIEREAV